MITSFAVRATAPGTDARPARQSDAMALRKSDVARLCPGVEPGGGRVVQCLRAHRMEMSVGCAKALQHMKARMAK